MSIAEVRAASRGPRLRGLLGPVLTVVSVAALCGVVLGLLLSGAVLTVVPVP